MEVFDKIVVRKIEVQDVDVKDGEAIILESSSVRWLGLLLQVQMTKLRFTVGGMTCVACIGSVEGIWRNLLGASSTIEHADFGASLVQKFLKNLKRSFPKLSIQGLCLIGVKE
ncbi:hypothetical protein V6N12_069305 [Hibiscus sabdariffa]|uniref:HMA domain-containing protein n=1 Tax=Hibiscus sabdariffa TaxID=183260 RepID=A0ABR2FDF7_9ROSI